jgi:hypothetical protein
LSAFIKSAYKNHYKNPYNTALDENSYKKAQREALIETNRKAH